MGSLVILKKIHDTWNKRDTSKSSKFKKTGKTKACGVCCQNREHSLARNEEECCAEGNTARGKVGVEQIRRRKLKAY